MIFPFNDLSVAPLPHPIVNSVAHPMIYTKLIPFMSKPSNQAVAARRCDAQDILLQIQVLIPQHYQLLISVSCEIPIIVG